MKICLVYHERLGDIIRVLPIARHLAGQGHHVCVECLERYRGIFDAVTYAWPSAPNARAEHQFDRVIDLQIWPRRYGAFRASGKSWGDFVFGIEPEFANLDQRPVFDAIDKTDGLEEYGFPRAVCLFAPFGYSQGRRHSFSALVKACRLVAKRPLVVLADSRQASDLIASGMPSNWILEARSPGHLPRLIRDAEEMFAINSAPCIIAGAVRSSFWHVSSGVAQDDAFSAASRIVTVDD